MEPNPGRILTTNHEHGKWMLNTLRGYGIIGFCRRDRGYDMGRG